MSEEIEIPFEGLTEDALVGVVDAFVLKEGTDYGHADISLTQKRQQVLNALKQGRAKIIFDPTLEVAEIVLVK